jgi:nucleotide-binding universal stress UspA family protein
MKPFKVTHILAATDLRETNLPALRCARFFADRLAAKLTIMYTDPIAYPVDFVTPRQGFYVSATPEHQANLEEEIETFVAPAMAGRPYELDLTVGQPIPAILQTAQERKADLIVMGAHQQHGWRHLLLGSVSDGVIHGSRCPVLAIAGDAPTFQENRPCAVTEILCPVNFTEVAHDALEVAAGLAQAFGAHLTIVHVVEPGEVTTVSADEERIREWVGPEVRERCSYREIVVRGGPSERVLDCVDDLRADLLVIGAQHKIFRNATVIGTTTERLVRFSSAPVLVVPREPVSRSKKAKQEREKALAAH